MSASAPDSSSRPRSLERWLSDLAERVPPVDPVVRAQALEELDSGLGGAARVAQILEKDPVQALLILRAANRALAKYGRDAATLEHAIALLGSDRARAQLAAAPAIDPDHPVSTHYRQALLRSQHAAWQARLWAEGSGRWHPEEIYWATLLAGAPLWLLWLEASDAMRALALRRARRQSCGTSAQKAELGASIPRIAAGLAQRWLLPEASRASWDPRQAGTARDWVELARAARLDDPPAALDARANDLSHHPALIVGVANALAIECDWEWYSRRTERLFAIAACACQRPLSTLLDYGHRTAAAFSRAALGSGIANGLLLPAGRLLCYWRERDLLLPPVSTPPTPAQPASAVSSAAPTPLPGAPCAGDTALFAAVLKRLRQPALIGSAREALALAPAALCRGAGLQRAAVLALGQRGQQLQTLTSAGCADSPLRQLQLPITGNDLLAQLLERPFCLTLDADNRTRLLQQLPPALRDAAGCDAFALMGLFAGPRPVALLYADAGGAELSVAQRSRFRQLSTALSATLAVLLKRRPS
jgi:hypothetical protein